MWDWIPYEYRGRRFITKIVAPVLLMVGLVTLEVGAILSITEPVSAQVAAAGAALIIDGLVLAALPE